MPHVQHWLVLTFRAGYLSSVLFTVISITYVSLETTLFSARKCAGVCDGTQWCFALTL